MEQPVALAFDQDLYLIAVAYAHGQIEIYGMPGLSFPVDSVVTGIKFMEFLRNEGRLFLATSSSLIILELNATSGHWEKKHSVHLSFESEEVITSFAIGNGVVYVGSSTGTLRQVAVENGNMTVGDDDLTSLPALLVLNKLAENKRESLKLNTAIVSIELHPQSGELLLGYAGGTAIVAQPQPIPVAMTPTAENIQAESTEKPEETESEKKSLEEIDVPTESAAQEETKQGNKEEAPPVLPATPSMKKSKTTERHVAANLHSIRAQATEKIRNFSRTIKSKIDNTLNEEKSTLPILPVPPSPLVTRILPYTQALCCATWRIIPSILASESTQNVSVEALVAYDDGAYLTWTISKLESEIEEPLIVVNQEVASIPYGPLPCAAIQRIVARPSVNGGVITAFVGGLPRAQHGEKHTISVLGGVEEHVCFQFGSAVRDFVILPSKGQRKCYQESDNVNKEKTEELADKKSEEKEVRHPVEPPKPTEAGYLLVLTDRELVAIDLTQTSWPVIPSPYLKHLDCTGITAVDHISIPDQLMLRLKEASGATGFEHWPVIGGQMSGGSCAAVVQHNEFHDLVAIAHANADVSFWHVVRGDCFEFLGRVSTLDMMADAGEIGFLAEQKTEEEAWPPFRKVGDCVCELPAEGSLDVRCEIHSLSLHLVNDEIVMLVGGGAGNFSMWSSAEQKFFEPDTCKISVDLLDGHIDKYTWEGPSAFRPVEGSFTPRPTSTPAFHLFELVQFYPPSAITTAAYEPKWEALAIGSAHGFALIDLKTHTVVHKLLTYGLHTEAEPFVSSVTREAATKIVASGRQLKATLRESFRKIRKIRPQTSAPAFSTEAAKGDDEVKRTAEGVVDEALAAVTKEEATHAGESGTEIVNEATGDHPVGTSKPSVTIAENEVESLLLHQLKPTDSKSGVSALALVDTYVVPGVAASTKDNRPAFKPPRTAALIVGTQEGGLITHTLAWTADNGSIEVNMVKEVNFQHGAPIISISALDSKELYSPVFTERTRSTAEEVPKPPEPVKPREEKSAGEVTVKPPVEGEEPAAETSTTAAPQVSTEVVPEGSERKESLATRSVVSHELLICTAEQVRVISLPSLKTKNKKSESASSATSNAAATSVEVAPLPTTTSTASQENADTKEAEHVTDEAPVVNPEDDFVEPGEKPEETPVSLSASEKSHAHSLRRVVSFGLQKIPTGVAETEEYHAVVGLKNGRLHVLTIPGLRRILKATCCEHPACHSGKPPPIHGITNACVSNSANLAFWPFGDYVLLANEISYTIPHRLVSPVTVHGLKLTEGDATYCVCLPEWARPKPPPAPTTVNATPSAADSANGDPNANIDALDEAKKIEGAEAVNDSTKDELKGTIVPDLKDSADTAKEVTDFTNDITKGIIADGNGTVTVKTTESSLEKHTVIEGGNVMTTVHETERIDGEVVKDDIVQVKSDVDDSSTTKHEVTA
nr:cell polarity protein; lethal giant larvae [Hymenolepis microstoma]